MHQSSHHRRTSRQPSGPCQRHQSSRHRPDQASASSVRSTRRCPNERTSSEKPLNRVAGLIPVRVGDDGNAAVRPIQAVGGDFGRGVAQVGRGVVDVRIERGGGGERDRSRTKPTSPCGFGRAHTGESEWPPYVRCGSDRTVAVARFPPFPACRTGHAGCLRSANEQEVNILDGSRLVFRFAAPRNVVRFGR